MGDLLVIVVIRDQPLDTVVCVSVPIIAQMSSALSQLPFNTTVFTPLPKKTTKQHAPF